MIHADFETRSPVDLLKTGAYIYAAHPQTDVNCLGWAIDEEETNLWTPRQAKPKRLLEAIADGEMIAAWNAAFERLIWNKVLIRYGFPPLPIERFYCIAALSRARGYPGKLEKAAVFAGIPYQKDMEGHYLMLKLCKPRRIEDNGTIIWWDDPGDHMRLGKYCEMDVKVERAMFEHFIPFTEQELADYHLSEHINDRGVLIDLPLARKAVEESEKEKIDASMTIKALTHGKVESHTEVAKIKDWVGQEWKEIPDVNKSTVLDLLQEDDIPSHVADVLELRIENARAAVSKFDAMLHRADDFGIVRGLYGFRGAGQTGRYISFGLQVHNLLADSAPEAIAILMKHGIKGLWMLGDPIDLLAKMVRPAFIASPGNTFLIGDYAQIEARITAWLAGEEKLLSDFRQGVSPYSSFGTKVTKRKIDKYETPKEYKVFKACVLGLGFGGAEGALARSLKKEGIILPNAELTKLVQAYRGTYTRIIQGLWPALRDAVLMALYSPGNEFPVGPVSYLFDREHLWCKLPSGRLMCYPFAKIESDEWGNDCVSYKRGNRTPKRGESEWPRVQLWYGMLTENLAQAIALDLLQGALRRLREWFVRLHTHDEIVNEVRKDQAEILLPEFLEIMSAGESWSEGLPVVAEGKISDRYTK